MQLIDVLKGARHRCCPACDADAANPLFTDHNRREGIAITGHYVVCTRCGTTYLNPIPGQQSLEAAYGDALVDRSEDQSPIDADVQSLRAAAGASMGFPLRILRRMHRAIKGRPHSEPRGPGEGRLIFDFGCLSGEKLLEYHERGWRVAGLDLNVAGIERARQRLPQGWFFCEDIMTFTPPEPFDVIRTDNVVEHLPDPKAVLIKLRTLLREGGRLHIMVPNGRALSIRLFGKYSVNYWVPFHLNLFTADALRSLLVDCGFSRVKVRTFSPNMSLSWSLRQRFAEPGFTRREPTATERRILRLGGALYPIEVAAGLVGLGEELIAEATA